MRNAIIIFVVIFSILGTTQAKAHHRTGPCDAHYAKYSGGVRDGITCTFRYVGASVDTALRVAWCESRWNRWATSPGGSYRGLFQHAVRYWDDRLRAYGTSFGRWIYGIRANSYISARLAKGDGWHHWSCY